MGWAARRRHWNLREAQAVFIIAAVVAAVAMSGYAAMDKVPAWRDADAAYREIGAWLDAHDVPACPERSRRNSAIVMVGNPPGFWYHTHRPAVVVPNGDVGVLLDVVQQYEVGYILLDRNVPLPLALLYTDGETPAWLTTEATWGTGIERVVLFRVERGEGQR